jgi:hypothetical protein
MNDDEVAAELSFLREECNRLRQERDFARAELKASGDSAESESALRLKLLSESLSREIRERLLSTVRSVLWIATLLVGVATAGGLWKLSDIVSARVDDKVREKEGDLAQLRQQIIKSVVDFERQARTSLDDIVRLKAQVARESETATGEINEAKARVLTFELSSGGSTLTVSPTAPTGDKVTTWFANVGDMTVGVAASQADHFAFDDGANKAGAFSLRFRRALADPASDTNHDGVISVNEAVRQATTALRRDKFEQTPTLVGRGEAIELFSSAHVSQRQRYKVVHAVIVGINRYQGAVPALYSAANDANGFASLLKEGPNPLFESSDVKLLLDEMATAANIKAAVQSLCKRTRPDDLIVFYFSGHTPSVRTQRSPSGEPLDLPMEKVLFPNDGNFETGSFIKIGEIVDVMNRAKARNALIIIDG